MGPIIDDLTIELGDLNEPGASSSGAQPLSDAAAADVFEGTPLESVNVSGQQGGEC
jgi:hypothetical protein